MKTQLTIAALVLCSTLAASSAQAQGNRGGHNANTGHTSGRTGSSSIGGAGHTGRGGSMGTGLSTSQGNIGHNTNVNTTRNTHDNTHTTRTNVSANRDRTHTDHNKIDHNHDGKVDQKDNRNHTRIDERKNNHRDYTSDKNRTNNNKTKGYWPSKGYRFVTVKVVGQRLGMRLIFAAEGIVLSNILSGGAAERCGLSEGDVIEQIDDTTVTSESDWAEALDNAEEVVTLKVRKAGSNEVLNVDVPAKAFVTNK